MTKLNQIVALEKGLKGRTKNTVTKLHQDLQKPALFTGFSRVYTPRDDEGVKLPAEKTLVQQTVPDCLEVISRHFTQLLDVMATKERGNMRATADVVVDGEVLVQDAPVTFLLALEKELIDWRTIVSKLPLLDSAEMWSYDEGNKQYRTEPTETVRSQKVLRALTLAPATDRHPAQVQTYNEDVPAGTWATTKTSGAIFPRRRDELVERANKLIDAVKAAREEANGIEIVQEKPAVALFAYLLA